MTTRQILSNVMRPLVAAGCLLSTASCGSELLRTGRAPVTLVIMQMDAHKGNETEFATPLLSDVQTFVNVQIDGQQVRVPTIFNDIGRAQIRAELKDQSGLIGSPNPVTTSPLNAITLTRYRVNFRRTDGRNTPGVDVPFGFDGALTMTIQPEGAGDVIFDLVRHASKSEPPLRNMIGGGGLNIISTIAEVTFYGRDQNGNEVTATGSLDVVFGDFGDES